MKSFIPLVATLAFAVAGAVPLPQLPFGMPPPPFGMPPPPFGMPPPPFGMPQMPPSPFGGPLPSPFGGMPQMPPSPFGGMPQMPPSPFGGMPQMPPSPFGVMPQMPPSPFGGMPQMPPSMGGIPQAPMNIPPWLLQLLLSDVTVNTTQGANMSVISVDAPEDSDSVGTSRQFSLPSIANISQFLPSIPNVPSIGQNFPIPQFPIPSASSMPNLPSIGQNLPIPQFPLPSGATPTINDIISIFMQMFGNGQGLNFPIPSIS